MVDLTPDPERESHTDRLADVRGRRVDAVCGTSLREHHETTSLVWTRWRRRGRRLSVRLSRDVAAAVRFCLLERDGGSDVPAAFF